MNKDPTFGQVLAPRELRVLQLMCSGNQTKEIAHIIGLTPRTVETYRWALKIKTGAKTGAQLGVWAYCNGHLGEA